LEERATEFFEIPPGGQADFMTQVYPVRPNAGIPAVTHVDGSGRVQTVKKSVNPRYWQMIAHFEELTGVPVVLNTSFNVKGQPIVNTPTEAIETFLATEMDGLALGDFLVLKPLP
jgi:carbamoyltransferase